MMLSAELAREVITAARARGYVVMVDQTDGDGDRERELLGRDSRATMFGDQPYATGETAQLRTAGYRQAHARAGLEVDERLVVSTPHFHRRLGAEAMEHLLALPEPPDAVFCYNDLLALGAIRALTRAGRRVPDDVAVVGVDDIEEGQYSTPSLTTIAPDKGEIARRAVNTLMDTINGSAAAPAEIIVPHRLIVRESTAG
ncbi:LacI family DNA-binding transcriptional regulator [Nonomuraea jabiensis]|uniref:LacI family DNA-binding transcriptional regulator n=1 Tax=Nonomuraea jabiensis TaxID=882448 RepID=UPI003D7140CC